MAFDGLGDVADFDGFGVQAYTAETLYSVVFDGSAGQLISLAGPATTTTFSLSVWIKPNTSTAGYGAIFIQQGLGNTGIYMQPSRKIDYYFASDNFNNTALTNGAWNHVAVVVNAGSVTFYLNGSSDGTASLALGFTANRIGGNPSESIKGNLFDVRVFDRDISAGEVTALHTNAGPPVPELLWYKFAEGGGTTATDSTGNGYTGTLTSGPTWSSDTPF